MGEWYNILRIYQRGDTTNLKKLTIAMLAIGGLTVFLALTIQNPNTENPSGKRSDNIQKLKDSLDRLDKYIDYTSSDMNSFMRGEESISKFADNYSSSQTVLHDNCEAAMSFSQFTNDKDLINIVNGLAYLDDITKKIKTDVANKGVEGLRQDVQQYNYAVDEYKRVKSKVILMY